MRINSRVIALVVIVILSGCTGFGQFGSPAASDSPTQSSSQPSASPTAVTQSATPSPTEQVTASPTTNPTPSSTAAMETQTEQPTATWSEPQPPNRPKEGKYDDDNRTRIYRGELVDKVESSTGEGYTNFNIEVDADTRMPDVDPPEHGDVEGEPYFTAYANEVLIYRSDYVSHKNDTFTLKIHPGSLKQFDEGSLDLMVFLIDRDSEYDDVYGVWTGTVQYAAE